MMPLFKARLLSDGPLLDPFDIYICLTEDQFDLYKNKIENAWKDEEYLSKYFNLLFISKEKLILKDENYFRRIFENSNIFARIMMPKSDSIGLEIGEILLDIQDVKTELYRFLFELCRQDINQIQQVIIDTETFYQITETTQQRLNYLYLLDSIFQNLLKYISEKYPCINNRVPAFRPCKHENSIDYLYDDFITAETKVKEKNGDEMPLHSLAALVGFDVPNDQTFYSPSVSIEISENIPGTRLPGIVITVSDQKLTISPGTREGIFVYTCCLVRYIEGKSFGMDDLKQFFSKIKKYTVKLDYDSEYEEPSISNWNYENYDFTKLPEDIKSEFQWYNKIYKALFYRERTKNYLGNKDFEQLCLHILHDNIRNPFIQGSSNIRTNIKKAMISQGLGALTNQVAMEEKMDNEKKFFFIDIKKENIKFPKNKYWKDLFLYNSNHQNE